MTRTRTKRVFRDITYWPGVELWRTAMSWRRIVDAALTPIGLTYGQWLVLKTTAVLEHETRDAVSQNDVLVRVGLDRATTSQLMRTLENLSLVDRGPSASGRALRIIVTAAGRRTLRMGMPLFEAANERFFSELGDRGANLARSLELLRRGARR